MKHTRIRRRVAAIVGILAVAGSTALVAAPAQAETIPPEYNLVRDVTGSATIAKRGMELSLPEGSKLYSKVTLGEDGSLGLASKLVTPPSTVKLRILDVPKLGDVTATVKIQSTADSISVLGPGTISTTNKFKITIPRLSSDLAPRLNLVKSTCASGEITAELQGTYTDLFTAPITVAGQFDIPDFKGCGISLFGLPSARDALISSMLAGPGNSLSLTLTPAAG